MGPASTGQVFQASVKRTFPKDKLVFSRKSVQLSDLQSDIDRQKSDKKGDLTQRTSSGQLKGEQQRKNKVARHLTLAGCRFWGVVTTIFEPSEAVRRFLYKVANDGIL